MSTARLDWLIIGGGIQGVFGVVVLKSEGRAHCFFSLVIFTCEGMPYKKETPWALIQGVSWLRLLGSNQRPAD